MVGVRAIATGALAGWLAFGCGGNAALEERRSSSSAGGRTGAGAGSTGGAFAGAASSTAGAFAGDTGSMEGASGAANAYIPTGAAVPPLGDGRLEWGGSFEHGLGGTAETPGAGWDRCTSRLPAVQVEHGGAADGMAFLRMPSAGQGQHDNGVDSQFAFWLHEGLPANEPSYVYFEIKNLNEHAPIGDLSIATADGFCKTAERLVTIPLDRLALSSAWQTRCVELRPTQQVQLLGWWAEGTGFVIGVDDFRFGPRCQH